MQREALHPLDQFRSFQTLRDKCLSEEDIAARFFVSATIVKQRLTLAAVSPKLLELYAEDKISLVTILVSIRARATQSDEAETKPRAALAGSEANFGMPDDQPTSFPRRSKPNSN